MNTITIIGRLTADPVYAVRNVSGVTMNVANFTVAVNSKNSAGQERTDYFKVAVWRGVADACAAYLHKGDLVAVLGSIGMEQREYNGRIYTNLVIHKAQVQFLEKLPSKVNANPAVETPANNEEDGTNETIANEMETVSAEEIDDDDLPF